MNGLHAVSVTTNNSTLRTALLVSVQQESVHAWSRVTFNDSAVYCVLLFLDAITARRLFIIVS